MFEDVLYNKHDKISNSHTVLQPRDKNILSFVFIMLMDFRYKFYVLRVCSCNWFWKPTG